MASLLISNVTTAPINKVIQYNKDDFAKILKSGFTYNIEDSTLKIIQAIADQVGAPEYIKTPKFDNQTQNLEKNRNYKKKYRENIQEISDSDWENIRKFQATVIEKKQGIEASINQIRKHLNKMTIKTYDTLKLQIIKEIQSITSDNIIDKSELLNELNKIGEALFTIASSNSFYSKIYANLYKELMEELDINGHNFMENIFKSNFQKFRSLFDKIDYCSPTKDYDTFCNNTKTNEKRRALSLFYINLMKLEALEEEQILNIITDLQQYMMDTIKIADSKDIVDELSEIISILIINGNSTLCKKNKWINIMQIVTQISKFKNTDYPSITNKTIFKHMDILDNIQKQG